MAKEEVLLFPMASVSYPVSQSPPIPLNMTYLSSTSLSQTPGSLSADSGAAWMPALHIIIERLQTMLHCFLAFGYSKKYKLENLRFVKCFGMQDKSIMQKCCLYLFGVIEFSSNKPCK